jgi:formylglycine-generating enzyme required for sulfatase activity
MRLNASKHPVRTTHRRIRWAAAALLTVSVPLFMVPSAAQSPGAKLEPYTETLPGSVVKVKMVPIPGGKITIKNTPVTIKPFYMASTETPWEAYDVFLASGPASPAYDQTDYPADAIARPSKSYILPDLGWGHNGWPAINVSFISVQMYCRWLAAETKKKYRLPTEAEWEWACRAGVMGPWKSTKAVLDKTAWWQGNSDGMTHPVGKKAPNKYGLYDMFGNPGEWATDLQGKDVLCGGTQRDGIAGQIPGMRRRWDPKWQETDPQFPKSRWWLADGRFVGFRVVCEP